VCVLRVDDEPGVVADRNWPSGVLRLSDDAAAQQMELHQPAESDGTQPHTVTLLQVQSSGTNTGAPCSSAAGHLEPLLPATGVFDSCAGVSHPVFTGKPAAWIPFLPHRAEERFATLFYDGLIDFNMAEAKWTRQKHTGMLDVIPEPFVGSPKRALIRAGSVIRFRPHAASKDSASSAGDSQRTTSDVSDEAAQGVLGVVLLTHVRVSTEYTKEWSDRVAAELKTHDPDGCAVSLEDLQTFCSLHPGTPIALCAVQRLCDGEVERGPAYFHPDVHVCDVISVCDASANDPLWQTSSATRTGKHLVVKPTVKNAKRKSKTATAVQTIEQDVVMQHCRVDKFVASEYNDDTSPFHTWFARAVEATRSRAHTLSNPTPQMHSFYHDIAHAAQQGWPNHRTHSLMTIRRIVNVPQPQPQLSEEIADTPQLPIASTRADHTQAAAEVRASAGKRQRTPHNSASAGAEPAEVPELAPAAPAASVGSRRPTRTALGNHTAAAKESAAATEWLFGELAHMDVSEAGAPFASLLQQSGGVQPLAQPKKKNVKMQYQAAYKIFSQQSAQSPAGMALLQQWAAKLLLEPPAYGAKAGVRSPLTEAQRNSICAELAALPPGTPMWMAHAGKRPTSSAPSCRDRIALAAAALQQQQMQQHPVPAQGQLLLPIAHYHTKQVPTEVQLQAMIQDALAKQKEEMRREAQAAVDQKMNEAEALLVQARQTASDADARVLSSTSTSSAARGRAPASAGTNGVGLKRKQTAAANSSSGSAMTSTASRAEARAAAKVLAAAATARPMNPRVVCSQTKLRQVTRSAVSTQVVVEEEEEEDDDDDGEAEDAAHNEEMDTAGVAQPPAKRSKRVSAAAGGKKQRLAAGGTAASPSRVDEPSILAAISEVSRQSLQSLTSQIGQLRAEMLTSVDDRVSKSAAELTAKANERHAQADERHAQAEQKFDRLHDELGKMQAQQYVMSMRMYGYPAQSQQSLSSSQMHQILAAASTMHLLGPPPQQAMIPTSARTIDAQIVSNGQAQPLTGYTAAQWPPPGIPWYPPRS